MAKPKPIPKHPPKQPPKPPPKHPPKQPPKPPPKHPPKQPPKKAPKNNLEINKKSNQVPYAGPVNQIDKSELPQIPQTPTPFQPLQAPTLSPINQPVDPLTGEPVLNPVNPITGESLIPEDLRNRPFEVKLEEVNPEMAARIEEIKGQLRIYQTQLTQGAGVLNKRQWAQKSKNIQKTIQQLSQEQEALNAAAFIETNPQYKDDPKLNRLWQLDQGIRGGKADPRRYKEFLKEFGIADPRGQKPVVIKKGDIIEKAVRDAKGHIIKKAVRADKRTVVSPGQKPTGQSVKDALLTGIREQLLGRVGEFKQTQEEYRTNVALQQQQTVAQQLEAIRRQEEVDKTNNQSIKRGNASLRIDLDAAGANSLAIKKRLPV
jgi:hypothetical protein